MVFSRLVKYVIKQVLFYARREEKVKATSGNRGKQILILLKRGSLKKMRMIEIAIGLRFVLLGPSVASTTLLTTLGGFTTSSNRKGSAARSKFFSIWLNSATKWNYERN